MSPLLSHHSSRRRETSRFGSPVPISVASRTQPTVVGAAAKAEAEDTDEVMATTAAKAAAAATAATADSAMAEVGGAATRSRDGRCHIRIGSLNY